jgi:hypothetical protein
MTTAIIEKDFKKKVSDQVTLAPEGMQRYRVFTPFQFDDGDHLAIIMRRENDRWILADEGHTFMHLTYSIEESSLQRGTRSKIITNALSAFSVADREGELVLEIEQEQFGDALFSFIQALLKISDVTYLSQERVKSAFMDDFHDFIQGVISEDRLSFDWHDPVRDIESHYPVDCRINGMSRPIFVYALQKDYQVRDATISLHQLERWGVNFRSVGIFETQEEINRKVLARFSDVCEKLYSNLPSNRERIASYFQAAMSEHNA